MNPISLMHLHKLLLLSSRSHWSATEPRGKTQPTATAHTQRKHTRHGCWQPKPVRPVSETGQAASVGLSLMQAGETSQTDLANRSDRLCPETPQRPRTLQEPFHIWTQGAIAQPRLPCSKTLLDSPQGETGQTGLCWHKISTLCQAHSKPNKLASHEKRFQDMLVNFPWKLTKDKVVKFQSLELAGWYQTVPYLRLESHVRWHIATRSYLPAD
jgi:hypothetical protein